MLNVFATTLVCTTFCTLNCRNCLIKIPFQEKKHTDFDVVRRSLAEYFTLVDRVNEFTIMGGEAFLYPHFTELMKMMDSYSNKIGIIFFITQASYVPNHVVLEAICKSGCNCHVHIDDYGKLSPKLAEVTAAFDDNSIKYDVRHYNEEEQYYGGWVDVVGDFSCQNYPDGGLDVYQRCKNKTNCKFIWDGILYGCGMHGAGVKLGKVPLYEGDSLSLLDDIPLERKKEIIAEMGTKPFAGCNYCYGWDVNKSPRIKAAIQLK